MLDIHLIFDTERLIVRNYTEADQENLFSMGGDEEIMRYIRPAQTREQSDAFLTYNIQYYNDHPMMGRWAVDEKISGKFVGSVAVIHIENTEMIQVGYSLLKKEWGKGYATELTNGALKYAFEKMKLPYIYGVTEVGNISSQKVLLKAGFEKELEFMEEEKELIRFIIKNKPNQF